MFALWLGLALLASVQAFPGGRIVNGTDAEPGEFPFIVSLKFGVSHTCGGSIINENWILTAAHCVYGRNQSAFSAQYGVTRISSDGLYTIPVEKVFYHAGYAPGNGYLNDVAVLKLEEPLEFNEFVQPVTLPPAFNATPGNADAVLAGWGLPYSGGSVVQNLQRVDINVFTDEDCESLHAFTGPTSRLYHVCAGILGGGKGQCNGDSGGPLVVNGTQVGVVSWSVKPCTIAPYPGVFAKVSSYVEWIYERIAEEEAGGTDAPLFVE